MSSVPFRSLVLSAALLLAAPAIATAQTAAGTLVTNTISLSYTSGADTPTVEMAEAASVEFRVDRKIDVLVAAQASGGQVVAVPGQTGVTLVFEVRNLGNDTQGFVLAIDDGGNIGAAGGLVYSATQTADAGSYYVMVGPNADGTDAQVRDVATLPNAGDLAAGGSHWVFIVANVPIGATDGQLDDFAITATVTDAGTDDPVQEDRTQGLMGVNTVIADDASNSSRTGTEIDAALNGADADETRLIVNAPVISASKTAVVLHEMLPGSNFDCAAGGSTPASPLAAIPGSCVEFTITVANAGTASVAANDIEITDPIPANTSYAGHSANNFTVTTSGAPVSSVTATISSLAPGAEESFTIRVIVD